MNQTEPAACFAKGLCRAVLAAILIVFMPATLLPAAAQDEEAPRWFGGAGDNTTILAYGIPDSDYMMLTFSCAIGKPVVSINVQDEESRAEEGALMHVRLSAGGQRIAFAEKAIPNEDSGGKDVKGQLPLNDTLRRILTAKGQLEIVVDGHRQRYDMGGAAKPAAAMLAACDAPKPASDLDVTVANKAKRPVQMLGAGGSTPAKAESVPASFDCAKAGNTVEKFICSRAVLRWQDLAMSRAYRAARNAVAGSARDDLVAGQRDWVRDRDRRCIADRTFAELADTSAGLGRQAYECLITVYLGRRSALQDRAASPLPPSGVRAIDLKPIAVARPEIADGDAPRIADIRLSPNGALAAILLPGLELDGSDQAWLYRIADGRLVAATPTPDRQQPHPDGAPMAIKALAWQDDTLYARVALWSKDSKGEIAPSTVYAATVDGSARLETVPAAIATLLNSEDEPRGIGRDEMTESDGESPQAIRGNRGFLAWIDDRGHGTIELRARKRAAGSPSYLVAWGGWGLSDYLFDANRSLLVYPADTGMAVFDLATHGERRIAGTSQGDRPYAISDDFGLLVWSTRNACGDERMLERDEDAPERFCLARLAKPEGSK